MTQIRRCVRCMRVRLLADNGRCASCQLDPLDSLHLRALDAYIEHYGRGWISEHIADEENERSETDDS